MFNSLDEDLGQTGANIQHIQQARTETDVLSPLIQRLDSESSALGEANQSLGVMVPILESSTSRFLQIRQQDEARLDTPKAQLEKVNKDFDIATAHKYARDNELGDGAPALGLLKARLENVSKDFGSATAQDDVKDCQLARGAETTRTQERRMRHLEEAAQGILNEQIKARLTMTELRTDLQTVNLALTNNYDRLALQVAHSHRLEITIQNLQAENVQPLANVPRG